MSWICKSSGSKIEGAGTDSNNNDKNRNSFLRFFSCSKSNKVLSPEERSAKIKNREHTMRVPRDQKYSIDTEL